MKSKVERGIVFGLLVRFVDVSNFTGRQNWWKGVQRPSNQLIKFMGDKTQFSQDLISDLTWDIFGSGTCCTQKIAICHFWLQ